MSWQRVRVTASGKKQVRITIAAYSDIIHKGLIRIVGSTAQNIRRGAEQRAPTGLSGTLRTQIKASKVRIGKRSITARVTSGSPYSSAVEFGGWKGTKNKPKGQNPPSRVFLPYVEQRFGLSGQMAARAAYLVARKIAEHGIEKRPFLGPAYVQARPSFFSRVYTLVGSQGPALVTKRFRKSLVTSIVE